MHSPSSKIDDHDDTKSITTYDYIVVGAGPSCVGLLYGLLTRPNSNASHLKIAVIERGPGGPLEPQSTSSPLPPHQWFRASHLQQQHNNLSGVTKRGRVLDVPVGRGLDGTANVNACLCIPPYRDDFKSWPEPFQSHLLESAQKIEATMLKNDCLCHVPCQRHEKVTSRTAEGAFDSQNHHQHSSHSSPSSSPHYWTETVFPSSPTSIPMAVRSSSYRESNQQRQQPSSRRRGSYWQGLLSTTLATDQKNSNTNIQLICGHVERLLLLKNSKCVVGVEFSTTASTSFNSCNSSPGHVGDNGSQPPATLAAQPPQFQRIFAKKEVILCAGALETPALLLVSGIVGGSAGADGGDEGDSKDGGGSLSSLLPVGEGLRDHVSLSRAIFRPRPFASSTKKSTSSNGRNESVNGVVSLDQIQVDGSRFQIAVMDGQAYNDILPHIMAGWLRWNVNRNDDDDDDNNDEDSFSAAILHRLSFMVYRLLKAVLTILLCSYSPLYRFLRQYVVTVSIFLLNPTSTGKVTLRPKRTRKNGSGGDRPLRRRDVDLDIQLGYLDSEEDLVAIEKGWLATSQVVSTFLHGVEVFPGPLIRRQWWSSRGTALDPTRFRLFCHATCLPYFHWCGTCRMSTTENKNGVVDADLRVRGYQGLRICDASVFPTNISAPTALTCAALGHVCGTRILPIDETDDPISKGK